MFYIFNKYRYFIFENFLTIFITIHSCSYQSLTTARDSTFTTNFSHNTNNYKTFNLKICNQIRKGYSIFKKISSFHRQLTCKAA